MTGLTIFLSLPYLKAERIHLGEYYGFILLALSGMMVMVSGADLLTIYLGTELMSLSLYVMTGLNRSEPRSLEACSQILCAGRVLFRDSAVRHLAALRGDRQHQA